MKTRILGIISVDFDVINQMLLRYSALVRHWRKIRSRMGQYINYLNILRSMTQPGEKYCTLFSLHMVYL
jgi:hypothetical protein